MRVRDDVLRRNSRKTRAFHSGRVEGKQYCQEFPVARGYSIAFLEPSSSNKTDHRTFTPADFVEILEEGNSTSQLLARTCNLHRLVPRQSLASVTEVCPAVATDPSCHEIVNTTVTTIVKTNLSNNATNIIVSEVTPNVSNKTILIVDEKGHLTQPIHTPRQALCGQGNVTLEHRSI